MGFIMRTSMVLAGACLMCAGTAVSAGAATLDVKVPFPFVVGTQAYPAGKYTVQWDDADPSIMLIEGQNGNRAGGLMLTAPPRLHDPAGRGAALTFRRYEKQYRLSGVRESHSEAWSVVAPR